MSKVPASTLAFARWEVLWVVKGPRIIVHDCGHNFVEALALYEKVKRAGRKMPTLRCKNVPFPPPDKYADHRPTYKYKKVKGKWRRVLKNGNPVVDGWELIEPRQYLVRMRHYNVLKDAWWCPYCMQFRHFERRMGFVSDETDQVVELDALYCPLCDIPHINVGVRRYNPLAGELAYRGKQVRGGRSNRGRKRR